MASFRTSAAGGGTSGTGDRSATITPAVGDLFVVFCCVRANTNTTPTCSDDNGGSYDLIQAGTYNPAQLATLSVFIRTSLLPNTTSTTVTVATGSNTAGCVHIIALSGMSRLGAAASLQEKIGSGGAGGTPALTFDASCLTENVTLGAVANLANPAAMTPPTDWTEAQDNGFSTPSTGMESVYRDSGFTGTTITWGSTSGTNFGVTTLEIDGSNTGTLSQTLGALTSTATGTVEIQGTLSQTLGALTVSAAGTVANGEVFGTLDKTLGALTSSAQGTVEVQGTLAQTLGALTSSAQGTVEIQGTLSRTLGALTSSAQGTVEVQGALSQTLGALVSTATGTVGSAEILGTLAQTLGALTSTATGTVVTPPQAGGTGSLTIASDSAQMIIQPR